MKKIIIVVVLILLCSGGFITGYILGDKNSNNKKKVNELNEQINKLNEQISQFENDNSVVVIKQIDGQIFIMKSDGTTYCQLGKEKDGNMIESTVQNDECVLTQSICTSLLSDGTTFFDEDPNFLKKCN